jgi:DNA-binding LacI/PurR family transcriptional regulator
MTAIGLLSAAGNAGLAVPEELAVVGFDDIPLASFVRPTLTTVAQPKAKMGQWAMEMVLSLMKAKESAEINLSDLLVQGELIVRESSGVR